MVVYIDVLLIENFIVNMFLLYITSQTVRVKVKMKALVLAASIGTSYILVLLKHELTIFTRLPFQILVATLMIFIILRNKSKIFLIKSTGLLILYSMLLSGLCFFIEYKQSNIRFYSSYSMYSSYKWILASVMLLYVIIHRFVVFVEDRKGIINCIYTVEIMTDGFSKKVTAFLDTGNELREPVTNLPVMVVERNILKDLNLREDDKLYIPYRVVDGSRGKMEGFKPKGIKIYYEEKKYEFRDVIIAFCDNKLSDLDDYSALLSRGII